MRKPFFGAPRQLTQAGEVVIGSTPDVDVAIVGSGPYGLSIAAHLAAVGVDHRIFGPPMRTSDAIVIQSHAARSASGSWSS
jgi:glycine/D-amino acid oxidase-like deaminating enzyme